VRYIVLAVVFLCVATPAVAQVGHRPEASPFRDIRYGQGLTAYAGVFNGNEGTAGVGLQSGLIVGGRHDWRLSGPLALTTRLGLAFSDRTVLDPGQPEGAQVVGTESTTLALADIGFSLQLTGARTWRRIAPVLHTAVGLSSDLGGDPDVGGFRPGTGFAFAWGGGVRWVPDGNIAFRLDFTDHLIRYSYPQTYFTPPAGGFPILGEGAPAREWRHNPALTVGLTYMFGR
jgi:hypothetical protein